MKRLAALLLVAIAACSHPDYKGPGQVVSVSYDDPDDTFFPTIVIQSCTSTGKTTICTPIIVPGHVIHDGPHWYVNIQGQDGKKHRISVPEQLFNGCKSGMRWTYGEGCSLG